MEYQTGDLVHWDMWQYLAGNQKARLEERGHTTKVRVVKKEGSIYKCRIIEEDLPWSVGGYIYSPGHELRYVE